MKKNLLALFTVGAFININAQTTANTSDKNQYLNTYIGNQAVVKVESNTLFYNGGNLVMDSNVAGTLLNEGNIYVTDTYTKQALEITPAPKDAGKEFVNVYLSNNSYGQLIVAGLTGDVQNTGFLTVERPPVSPTKVQYLNISIPFQGKVDDIVNSYTNVNFSGDCKINSSCPTRYSATLLKWNNNSIVWDAVPKSTLYEQGSAYTLAISENTDLNAFYTSALNNPAGVQMITYRGRIAPSEIKKSAISRIHHYQTPEIFATIPWKDWKKRINPYREYYQSYITTNDDNESITSGKNIHQYGNPYTSNITLLDPSQYVKVDGQMTGGEHLISIAKFTNDASVNWNSTTGSSYTGEFLARQELVGGKITWVGNAEALIIRPTEKFTVNVLPKVPVTDSKIYPVEFTFSDDIKTFDQQVVVPASNVNNKNKVASTSEFSQLEVFFTEPNGEFLGFPIYLAASEGFKSGTIGDNDGLKNYSYFLQEDTNSELPISNSETMINIIGDEYRAKPVFLGLTNDVTSAKNYSFRFKLYDENIFNEVEETLPNDRKFFLEDTKTNKVIEIKNNQQYFFDLAQDDNLENRFAVYWKEYKGALGTEEVNKYKTVIYKNNNYDYFVRLNSAKKSVNIEIYNISGQKIDDLKNVATTSDYKLSSLNNQTGVYIVKLTYADGETVNTKVIVK